MRPIEARWLGRLPYGAALELQRSRREAVLAGTAPEALWALEHDPVITVGRRAAEVDRAALARSGTPIFEVERGGLATWHGPGQLVVYAILDAPARGLGARLMVEALEDGIIDWLAAQGQAAGRRAGFPGVWVPSPHSPAGVDKIAAIGLHFRRGVSMHGLALNLRPDLAGFADIVPCGISDAGVTSLMSASGASPSPEQAADGLLDALLRRLSADTLDEAPTIL